MKPEPTSEQVRARLVELAAGRPGGSLAALSRMIGRSSGYLATFVRDGEPTRLADKDREALAAFFGVEEWELGGYIRPGYAKRAR